jgi:hypothetical protein
LSDDDYQCDVYVYEDASFGGWTTWVASHRPVLVDLPDPIDLPDEHTEAQFAAFYERWRAVGKLVEKAERIEIGLPHDDGQFRHGSPGECADNLLRLREMGYNVPDYAIERLRAEQAEGHTNPLKSMDDLMKEITGELAGEVGDAG